MTKPRQSAKTSRSTVTRRLAAAMLLAGAFVLGGCATYPGAYGGGYPGGAPGYPDSYGGQYGSQMVGTVQQLDRGYNRIVLVVEDQYGRRGQQVAVQYDQRTRLYYQGRQHPVEGLERGDVIRIDSARSGNRLYARNIEVLRNVREGGYYGGSYGQPDPYGSGGGYGLQELRGRVAFVDQRSQLIRLDSGGYGGRTENIRFDARTVVEYQGRRYQPRDLDPGDIVRIQVRRVGNQWYAERIMVEASARRR